MGLCRTSRTKCKWEEMGGTGQNGARREVINRLDGNSIGVYTDGSALVNPGRTGTGAAIFYQEMDCQRTRVYI